MTFDDDVLRIVSKKGDVRTVRCALNGIAWPPPYLLTVQGVLYAQGSCSEITDEQRQGMTHVCRGAVYHEIDATFVDAPSPKEVS